MAKYLEGTDRIAVTKRVALKMFWDAGFDTEELLLMANELLDKMPQSVKGYWLADTVSMVISMEINRRNGR